MAASHEKLYSFDPFTQKAMRHSIGENFDSLAIDQNNRLYLIQDGHTLVKYDPETGVVRSVIIPDEGGNAASSLLVDRDGRLWVSDSARYDNAVSNPYIGDPFAFVRSPVFIKYFSYAARYIWFRPRIILQSIDGRIWYDGDVWFDPTTGEWCRFTTFPSNIVEDSDSNLWMIADGRLFELVLEK